MPRQKSLLYIYRLLDGTARKWYWVSVDEINSWDEFVEMIRLHFFPKNYKFFLLEEIKHRLQAQNETFASFITDMKALFQKANPPIDEDFEMYIVERNMLPEYSSQMSSQNNKSLNDLIRV